MRYKIEAIRIRDILSLLWFILLWRVSESDELRSRILSAHTRHRSNRKPQITIYKMIIRIRISTTSRINPSESIYMPFSCLQCFLFLSLQLNWNRSNLNDLSVGIVKMNWTQINNSLCCRTVGTVVKKYIIKYIQSFMDGNFVGFNSVQSTIDDVSRT